MGMGTVCVLSPRTSLNMIHHGGRQPSNQFVTWPIQIRRPTTQLKKSTRGDTKTVLAVVRRSQNFPPRRRPFQGAQDGQNSISWRWSLPLPTNPVWCGSMHAFRVIVVTDPQTDRGDLRPSSKSAQRRRKHCMLAAVRQTISPRHRPPSRGRGTANI